MAKICIVLEDLHNHNVDVQFHLSEPYPESSILWTNAQQISKEIERSMRALMRQANDSQHQSITNNISV